MRKFKVTMEVIIKSNRSKEKTPNLECHEIEADYYDYYNEAFLITQENVHQAKDIDKKYNVGDFFDAPIKSIRFYIGNELIKEYNILGDPYFKLEEYKEGKWELIAKYNCYK